MLKTFKLLKTVVLLCGVSYGPACVAQGQELVGKWTNVYGSLMTIDAQSKGKLHGIYSSTTGSSGKYEMVGTYGPSSPDGDLPVAITILWNSIDSTTKDPSQFWTSVMVGAYYGENGVMELVNQIAAAEKFAVVSVMEPGIYPESLTFTKKQDSPKARVVPVSGEIPKKERSYSDAGLPANNQLNGTWKDQEGQYVVTINVVKNDVNASVSVDGKVVSAIGLAANPAKAFQSMSVASSPLSTTGPILGITGLLDIARDKLKLVVSRSRGVAYKDKYVTNNLNVFNLDRASP